MIAGLSRAKAAAADAAIKSPELDLLIAAHLAGCNDAEQRLRAGLLYMVYRCPVPLLGTAYVALCDTLAYCRRKEKPDVLRRVRNSLYRYIRQHHRDEPLTVRAPASTRRDALKRGDSDPDLTRQPFTDPLDPSWSPTMEMFHDVCLECDAVEMAVIRLLVSGSTEREIATRLDISRYRVRQLRARIREQFNK